MKEEESKQTMMWQHLINTPISIDNELSNQVYFDFSGRIWNFSETYDVVEPPLLDVI